MYVSIALTFGDIDGCNTLLSTMRAVISTYSYEYGQYCNSTSDSKCYWAVRVQVSALLLP